MQERSPSFHYLSLLLGFWVVGITISFWANVKFYSIATEKSNKCVCLFVYFRLLKLVLLLMYFSYVLVFHRRWRQKTISFKFRVISVKIYHGPLDVDQSFITGFTSTTDKHLESIHFKLASLANFSTHTEHKNCLLSPFDHAFKGGSFIPRWREDLHRH